MTQPHDPAMGGRMGRACNWFESLRDRLCAEFEAIEDALSADAPHGDLPPGRFVRETWQRQDADTPPGEAGGGTMAMLRGRVFEKLGVNVSAVNGRFAPSFAGEIPGAAEAGGAFRAAGISLVAHLRSPLVPAVHMNTRMIVTAKSWFGGGADLNPAFPVAQDTADFHAALGRACDAHDPAYHAKFRALCDEYFFIRHRNEPRGVGGIFYDNLDSGDWEADFAFTRDVGTAFLAIYPRLVRRNMHRSWTPEQRETLLVRRGRYVEFNLVYDRGTRFGLMTGGNPDAVLMSLPPEVKWP